MISVLTPTYNRAYTLERLYHSLLQQNDYDFEWIIIDDGSTDGTAALVKKFINQNRLKITYSYKDNAGKPSAINTGVKICHGEFVFIVDSDDAVTDDAIACLKKAIADSDMGGQPFSGVGFRKAKYDGAILGTKCHENTSSLYLTATEAGALFKGDLAYCFNRDLLMKYPFPFYEGEKFVPELFIWNKITDEAKVKFSPDKVIYLAEYLSDGLTNNFKLQLKNNPCGFKIYYKDQFQREHNLLKKIKMFIRFMQCFFYERIK